MSIATTPPPDARRRLLFLLGKHRSKRRTMTEEILAAEWRLVDSLKAQSERGIERAAHQLFEDQKRDVIRRVYEHVPVERVMIQAAILKRPFSIGSVFSFVARLFDVSRWNTETTRRFAPRIVQVLREGFGVGMDRVGVEGVDFTSGSPRVRLTLRETLLESTRINDTTKDLLAAVVQQSLTDGLDLDQIAARIETEFDGFKGYRAKLAARTLGTAAFESGQQEAFVRAGIGKKRWLSQRDPSVRPSHLTADGQEVTVEQAFEIGGYQMQYPGDPSLGAPLSERANCRCTSLPIM